MWQILLGFLWLIPAFVELYRWFPNSDFNFSSITLVYIYPINFLFPWGDLTACTNLAGLWDPSSSHGFILREDQIVGYNNTVCWLVLFIWHLQILQIVSSVINRGKTKHNAEESIYQALHPFKDLVFFRIWRLRYCNYISQLHTCVFCVQLRMTKVIMKFSHWSNGS